MRVVFGLLALCGPLVCGVGAAQEPAPTPPPELVKVVIGTALGDIQLALERERAPVTVENFLRYVDAKRFDGTAFYRAMRITEDGQYGLLQGGLKGNTQQALPPIPHESPSVTGLSHLDGSISMAREAPGTARADWFIVLGDLKSLDGKGTEEDPGYAVFGRVVEGMAVVRQILDQPRDPEAGEGAMKGQMLAPPVAILTVRRID
jgi:peptidyl-prolyl cis-trans isomerase A (cyclophilin A)